jgi:predicted transcriptional regulator of viral defense system
MNPTAFLLQHAIFTTRQFAALSNVRVDAASRSLGRLASSAGIVRVTRGLWCQPGHPRFSAYAVVPFLLANEHGYVSFLSAMHRYGLVSQIPGSIQAATTGHSRALTGPIGRFEFIQIKPQMMTAGIESSDTEPPYGIASAEKALLDTLYIATRKGRRFARLPEVDMSAINQKRLRVLLDEQVPAPQVRRAIDARLLALANPPTHGTGRRPNGIRTGAS